jgi:hypothetical protein
VACSEFVGDVLVADKADDSGEECREGEEEGGGGGRVAVRGAKKSEGAAAGCGEGRVGVFVGGHGWLN